MGGKKTPPQFFFSPYNVCCSLCFVRFFLSFLSLAVLKKRSVFLFVFVFKLLVMKKKGKTAQNASCSIHCMDLITVWSRNALGYCSQTFIAGYCGCVLNLDLMRFQSCERGSLFAPRVGQDKLCMLCLLLGILFFLLQPLSRSFICVCSQPLHAYIRRNVLQTVNWTFGRRFFVSSHCDFHGWLDVKGESNLWSVTYCSDMNKKWTAVFLLSFTSC